MARDAATIQAEIERARDGLAVAVDEITTRADPQRALDEGKRRAQAVWDNPKVKYPVIALGTLIAALWVRRIIK